MNKPLDKTKSSNIKCEHCKYFDKEHTQPVFVLNHIEDWRICSLTGKPKNYWNRCKWFDWADRYAAAEVSDETDN